MRTRRGIALAILTCYVGPYLLAIYRRTPLARIIRTRFTFCVTTSINMACFTLNIKSRNNLRYSHSFFPVFISITSCIWVRYFYCWFWLAFCIKVRNMPRHSKSIVSLVINCGILSGTQLKSKQKFSKQRQRLDFFEYEVFRSRRRCLKKLTFKRKNVVYTYQP